MVLFLCTDDSDLVYWAAGLLHQFAIQDLHKAEICAIPNIIKALQNVLCSSEAILQRLILRVLSFLCVGNQPFRTKVLACSSLLARLPVCLASGDNDIVHWAVVLLHDLILSEGLFPCLLIVFFPEKELVIFKLTACFVAPECQNP